jgi:hypothetical protein
MKKNKGVWKKERATGRKYSKSDAHKFPKAGTRKKFWIGSYTRKGKRIKGYFKKNPNYKK